MIFGDFCINFIADIDCHEGEEYFLMNWGWGGKGDDGIYYADSSYWTVPECSYSCLLSSRKIMYDFKNFE